MYTQWCVNSFPEEDFKDKGKLYKPSSKLQDLTQQFSTAERAASYKSEKSDRPEKPGKKLSLIHI